MVSWAARLAVGTLGEVVCAADAGYHSPPSRFRSRSHAATANTAAMAKTGSVIPRARVKNGGRVVIGPPKAGYRVTPKPGLSCIAFIYGISKDNRADESDRTSHGKRQRGCDLPQQATKRRGGSDGHTADEIVQADRPGAGVRGHQVENERLAGRLPDLAQST